VNGHFHCGSGQRKMDDGMRNREVESESCFSSGVNRVWSVAVPRGSWLLSSRAELGNGGFCCCCCRAVSDQCKDFLQF
jgi:hypothetical protein